MLVEEDINVDNINSIRSTIRRSNKERFNPAIIEGIVSRRVFFKWLPVTYVTDLEQGAMYWVAASIISALIPIFPLVSLYQYWFKDKDDDILIVPRPDNAAVYAMLIWVGIAFTIGSFLFHRAVRHPPVAPLFKWKHICTDELHAMWWFFFGTLPSVPVTAIYCYHNGAVGQYGLALALAVIASIVMELAVFASYPMEEGQPQREWFSPIVHYFFPIETTIGKYCHNDWLIICWGFLFAALIADLMAFVILMYYCGAYNADQKNRGAIGMAIYNFGTGLFTCLLFTMGCLYMLSGSTFHANYDSNKSEADVEAAEDLEFVNVIKLQEEVTQPSAPQQSIRKPAPNSDPLTVVLVPGAAADHQHSASIFRVGNVKRDSPPIPSNQEPVDDIPPPEEDESLVVSRSAGTNRYSLALTGNKEFSL